MLVSGCCYCDDGAHLSGVHGGYDGYDGCCLLYRDSERDISRIRVIVRVSVIVVGLYVDRFAYLCLKDIGNDAMKAVERDSEEVEEEVVVVVEGMYVCRQWRECYSL